MPLADPQEGDPLSSQHHDRIPAHMPCYNPLLDTIHLGGHSLSLESDGTAIGAPVAVARSCSLKEALSNPKAKAALDKEWDRL
eukprot:2818898-Prorocentrum_lima.AAC.1